MQCLASNSLQLRVLASVGERKLRFLGPYRDWISHTIGCAGLRWSSLVSRFYHVLAVK